MKKLEKNENVKINTNLYLEVEIGKTFNEMKEELVYNLGLLVAKECGSEEEASKVELDEFLNLDCDNLMLKFRKETGCGFPKTMLELMKAYSETFNTDELTSMHAAVQTFCMLVPFAGKTNEEIWQGLGEDLEKAYNIALEEAFMSEDEF